MDEAVDNEELQVSVCTDCARHPSLKKMINADLATGICAFCCRTDAQVRNPENIEPMVMLMRALIRYYWDEFSYNSHWGGEAVLELFNEADNPVVEPFAANDYYDEFDHHLQEPPYPDWDKGVSIYAGFDAEGMRLLNSAISRSTQRSVGELRRRLDTSNFAKIESELEALIKPFLADLKFVLPKGGTWFRARTGFEARFLHPIRRWPRYARIQVTMYRLGVSRYCKTST